MYDLRNNEKNNSRKILKYGMWSDLNLSTMGRKQHKVDFFKMEHGWFAFRWFSFS